MQLTRPDQIEARARELSALAGFEPDARIERAGQRSIPAWCLYRDAAQQDLLDQARELPAREARHADAPLTIVGDHQPSTIAQMQTCMTVGNVIGAAICADGHLG